MVANGVDVGIVIQEAVDIKEKSAAFD